MLRKVPPALYAPLSSDEVEFQLRHGIMPDTFIRRMRVVNVVSALTIRKLDPDLIKPFDVTDIHHILDKLVSADAIIQQFASAELSYACTTGNTDQLFFIADSHPLLKRGLALGWYYYFMEVPFHPICLMLAMRAKTLLDLVDVLGHSYNLLRGLGYGWIDWDDIPGDGPIVPDNTYPPDINIPLYIPFPILRIPLLPEWAPPSGPVYRPPWGFGNPPGGSMNFWPTGATPGVGPDNYWWGNATNPSAFNSGQHIDCCASGSTPGESVSIGFTTQGMQGGEEQDLTVADKPSGCGSYAYQWKISAGGGSLSPTGGGAGGTAYGPMEGGYAPGSSASGPAMTYTAPTDNVNCLKNPTIQLWCNGVLRDSFSIAVNIVQTGGNAYENKYTTSTGGACCAYTPYSCGANPSPPDCNGMPPYCGPRATYMCVQYNCAGDEIGRCSGSPAVCYYTTPGDVWETKATCLATSNLTCGIATGLGISDMRTGEQLAAGCCPEEML